MSAARQFFLSAALAFGATLLVVFALGSGASQPPAAASYPGPPRVLANGVQVAFTGTVRRGSARGVLGIEVTLCRDTLCRRRDSGIPAGSRSLTLTVVAPCVRGRSGTARTWRGHVRWWTRRAGDGVTSPAVAIRCIEIGVA